MGSKIIAITGLIVSAAFVYYCIDFKKQEIASACTIFDLKKEKSIEQTDHILPKHVEDKADKAIVTESEIVSPVIKSDPAFGVMLGDQINIVGMFAPEAKEKALMNFIEEFCTHKDCLQDIRYSEDIKTVSWYQSMIDLITFFTEENIEKGSMYINSNVLHIEGKIRNKDQKKRLEDLIERLKKDGLFVEDETINLIEEVGTKRIERNISVKKVETQNADTKDTPEKIETQVETVKLSTQTAVVNTAGEKQVAQSAKDEIQTIMKENSILFDTSDPNRLTDESEKTLDRIIGMIKKDQVTKIEIIGYSNTNEGKIFDNVVSQKRADLVKNYLARHGVRYAISKGMGSKRSDVQIEIKIVK